MRLTEYQLAIQPSMAYSPEQDRVGYHALGLSGEIGEVCNKLKKVYRGDYRTIFDAKYDLIGELGGCTWYAAALCNDLDIQTEDHWCLSPKMLTQPMQCGLRLARAAGVIADVVLSESDVLVPVVTKQVASVFSYVNMLAWWINKGTTREILDANLALIADRHARGVVHGNGDHR